MEWSSEHEFRAAQIRVHVPRAAGVYEILQSREYNRYEGTTRKLKIGMSRSDLREELLNHVQRHAAANRLARVLNRTGIRISFRYSLLEPQIAAETERRLLCEFEDSLWDLPVLNSNRGYKRGTDRHYRRVALDDGNREWVSSKPVGRELI